MPKTKKSDLQVLRAVLALPDGKLSSKDKTVFQRMYDDVAGGMVIQLSKKQRLWVDGIYDKHDLDKPQNRGTKAVQVLDKSRLAKPSPKPAERAKQYQTTPKGQAQIEAFKRLAKELDLGDPIPPGEYLLLIPAISDEDQKAIAAKAEILGRSVESVTLGYIGLMLSRA